MAGWLSRLFSSGDPEQDLPTDRLEQGHWRREQHAIWQAQWHDLFDQDVALSQLAEFQRPDPLPVDMMEDSRLTFGFTRVTLATRAACLELFPAGDDMQRRTEALLTLTPAPMAEGEARDRLIRLADLIDQTNPDEKVDWSAVTMIERDTREGLDQLLYADPVSVLLDNTRLEEMDDKTLRAAAASSYLAEPLYVAGGRFMEPRDWITAAMTGGIKERIHGDLYQLWSGGWQVFLSENGVLLAKRAL